LSKGSLSVSLSSNPEDHNHNSQDNVAQVEDRPGEQATAEPQMPVEEESPATPESRLLPEAQGETNGGPLGCCLGVAIGLMLSLSVAILSRIYATPLATILSGNLSLVVRIVMALVALVFAIICGYSGWKIGKKLFREYEPPVIKDRSRQSRPGW
jgi:hypothetical protein